MIVLAIGAVYMYRVIPMTACRWNTGSEIDLSFNILYSSLSIIMVLLFVHMPSIAGPKLAQDGNCYFETNSTETTCTVNITAIPPSVVGGQSLLILELLPSDYNLVSNQSLLSVFLDRIAAGVWANWMA